MSALPKQVLQQQKEVEALEQQLYAQAADTAEPTPDTPPAAADTPPAELTPTAPAESTPPKEDPTWEQRYKTLQGMFQAEVPRLQAQNKDLVTQLQAMQHQIVELQKPKVVETPLVTDEDREKFGPELIDAMQRVTKQVMREHVAPLQGQLAQRDAKIAQLEAALTKTTGDVNTLSFEQRLNLAIPDFEQLNVDPKWVAWLDEIDPFTGEPRRVYAEYVYGAGMVDKVKNVVDLYKSQIAPTQQLSATQRKTELERQAQPTRTAGNVASPQTAQVYTEAQASALFDKVRKLNINGKYEEAARLEAELTAAYMEGRVRA
jgi:hypothetical protein